MSTTIKYADLGTTVQVVSYDETMVQDKLKPAVYSVGFNPMSGFFLKKQSDRLPTPSRVYGSVKRKVDKIVHSYNQSSGSFGILLSGVKGSGKTMTSSLAANACLDELNIPVVLVEDSFEGSGFVDFITKLGECVLFIDEFGKKFSNKDNEQDSLLGLFDGTSASKRLVVLTENNVRSINTYILDRPGRVHYHFRHEKLEEDIIREYCESKEVPEGVIETIILRRDSSIEFSFDVLQAIVREYINFGGEISEICEDLNIEQPISFNSVVAEFISAHDATEGCPRTIAKDTSSESKFPHGTENGFFLLEGLGEPDNEGDIISDRIWPQTREIIAKEGSDIFVFKTRCDEGHDIILKVRRVEKNPFQYNKNAL